VSSSQTTQTDNSEQDLITSVASCLARLARFVALRTVDSRSLADSKPFIGIRAA